MISGKRLAVHICTYIYIYILCNAFTLSMFTCAYIYIYIYAGAYWCTRTIYYNSMYRQRDSQSTLVSLLSVDRKLTLYWTHFIRIPDHPVTKLQIVPPHHKALRSCRPISVPAIPPTVRSAGLTGSGMRHWIRGIFLVAQINSPLDSEMFAAKLHFKCPWNKCMWFDRKNLRSWRSWRCMRNVHVSWSHLKSQLKSKIALALFMYVLSVYIYIYMYMYIYIYYTHTLLLVGGCPNLLFWGTAILSQKQSKLLPNLAGKHETACNK